MSTGAWRPHRALTLLVTLVACSGPARPTRSAPGAASRAEPEQTTSPSEARAVEASPVAAPTGSSAAATDAPDEEEEAIDDGFESTVVAGEQRPHPLAELTDAEIERRLQADPRSVGSMSVGRPSGGTLINGVRMPEGDAWRLVDPDDAWGTEETVAYLSQSITAVASAFPGTLALPIGHISGRNGGPLEPHLSHQAGRDVDVGYYYRNDDSWYRRGTAQNLDLERTWAFVRALVTQTDVELILIDRSIQRLLREHAERVGEDRTWLDDVFRGSGPRGPLIRHAAGHGTHLHVRFFNPIAQETARRCVPLMVRQGLVEPPVHYVQHRVKKGETLGKLAKRYDTTIREIMRANGLRKTLIQAKKTYRIPRKGPPPMSTEPVRVPERRLPPGPPLEPAANTASQAP